jgi:hypothetical protein
LVKGFGAEEVVGAESPADRSHRQPQSQVPDEFTHSELTGEVLFCLDEQYIYQPLEREELEEDLKVGGVVDVKVNEAQRRFVSSVRHRIGLTNMLSPHC